ncbi:uncharacterized protein N7496_001852 [Penicillium cataractarum]|uniref:Mitochondrial division protein 1 n=1 Tax=Penicillium cataractarum TaxID=2100454 RepID=A0A9X0B791_9EURO|nr:uncharacterized protein N7496_001852 [Penicillium cataractarum]KAJ5390784.1 hypothetical protein N7496_001852 [Penicillium cataractarum]
MSSLEDGTGTHGHLAERPSRTTTASNNKAYKSFQNNAPLHIHDGGSFTYVNSKAKGNVIDGTCRWITDVQEFESWLNGTNNLLWISGGPGKGKTFLSIYLVDILRTLATEDKGPSVLLLFCDHSNHQRNTALAVIRGLLYQMLEADEALYDDILGPFKLRKKRGENLFSDAFLEELWKIFEKMVARDPRPRYFVLDGLDECDRKSIKFLTTKLEGISSLHAQWNIKTVVVSRPDTTIHTDLRIDLDQEHHQRTEEDVHTFVQVQVKDICGIGDQRPELAHLLLDRAHGTFLWVWLATAMLKEKPDLARQILESEASANVWLPEGLDAMYDRMLLGIQEINAEAAAVVLRHVAMACRPLTREELRYICADQKIDHKKVDLQLDFGCKNLLIITGETVHLVHLSLKEYLVSLPRRNLSAPWTRFLPFRRQLPGQGKSPLVLFGINEKRAHADLLLRCLGFMELKFGKERRKLHPSTLVANIDKAEIRNYLPSHVQYACMYWVRHLTESQARVLDHRCIQRFLEAHFLHWLEALSLIGSASESDRSIQSLQRFIQPTASPAIASFLADASRFVHANIAIFSKMPSQIYTSALAFAPRNSILKRNFRKAIPEILSFLPEVESDWSACLKTLEGNKGQVTSVSFSQDAKLVVSGSDDNKVIIWDAITGAEVQTFEVTNLPSPYYRYFNDFPIGSVAFSHDTKFVVSGIGDGSIRIWDIEECTDARILRGHSASVNSVVFSHDGKLVVSGASDLTIKIWDFAAGILLRTLDGHSHPVLSVAFLNNTRLVVSGSSDHSIRIWDIMKGTETRRLQLQEQPMSAMSIAFSRDANIIASGSADSIVRIWDIEECANVRLLLGHSGLVESVAVSHDGKLVVSGATDMTIKIWDVIAGTLLQTVDGHSSAIFSVAFSNDARLVVSGSQDKTVKILDTAICAKSQSPIVHDSFVVSVAFSHDARILVSGSTDSIIRVWDATTGTEVQRLVGHLGPIGLLAFSRNRQFIVSASKDQTIKIWDIEEGTEVRTFEGHTHQTSALAISNDAKLLASGSYNSIKIRDTATGAEVLTFEAAPFVTSVAFSPDANLVVSGSSNGCIRIWDITKGPDDDYGAIAMSASEDTVKSVSFSHNAKLVVSGSMSGTIKFWDTATGMAIAKIKVGFIISHVSFHLTRPYLCTDRGLVGPLDFERLHQGDPSPSPNFMVDVGYGISSTGAWITWNGENVLWLPPNYRPMTSAVVGDAFEVATGIALITHSRRFIFLRFAGSPKPI